VTRRQRAAQRLATGSAALTRRIWDRACAWCARGRREDLTGWRAALGPILRAAGLLVAAIVACLIVRRRPWLLWVLSGWWTLLSWRAGKAPSPPATESATAPDVEAVRRLLLDVMGDASAVHLRTVLAHLQKHHQWEGRKVADLRVHLERLGVPINRSVKVAGVPTWGVRRRDLEAPSPVKETEASPNGHLPA
jgi:hypothetical protein